MSILVATSTAKKMHSRSLNLLDIGDSAPFDLLTGTRASDRVVLGAHAALGLALVVEHVVHDPRGVGKNNVLLCAAHLDLLLGLRVGQGRALGRWRCEGGSGD